MILLGRNYDADDADGIEDAIVNHRSLDIKLVMVSIQPNRMALMRQMKGTYSLSFF